MKEKSHCGEKSDKVEVSWFCIRLRTIKDETGGGGGLSVLPLHAGTFGRVCRSPLPRGRPRPGSQFRGPFIPNESIGKGLFDPGSFGAGSSGTPDCPVPGGDGLPWTLFMGAPALPSTGGSGGGYR